MCLTGECGMDNEKIFFEQQAQVVARPLRVCERVPRTRPQTFYRGFGCSPCSPALDCLLLCLFRPGKLSRAFFYGWVWYALVRRKARPGRFQRASRCVELKRRSAAQGCVNPQSRESMASLGGRPKIFWAALACRPVF